MCHEYIVLIILKFASKLGIRKTPSSFYQMPLVGTKVLFSKYMEAVNCVEKCKFQTKVQQSKVYKIALNRKIL